MSTIGTNEWTEKMIKAALDNRSKQLNPNNCTYWKCRDCRPAAPPVNPLLAVFAGAALGAAASAAAILGIQKLIQIKKEKEAEQANEVPAEGTPEVVEIEIEEPAEEKKEEQ